MGKNKLNLQTLRVNRDAGKSTEIPPKGEGSTLSPENIARINASEFLGDAAASKTELAALADGSVGGDAAKMEAMVAGTPNHAPNTPVYGVGKRYSPKTDRNAATWTKILMALATGPKTLAELTKAVEDHKDFVGYMVRGGHLVVPQLAN